MKIAYSFSLILRMVYPFCFDIIEDGADSDSVDSKSFWKVISGETASSPQPDIKTAEQGVDDIEHEKQVEQKMQLYG